MAAFEALETLILIPLDASCTFVTYHPYGFWKVTLVMDVYQNAPSKIAITLEGIETLVKDLQPAKAPVPITSKFLGSVIFLKL